MELKEKITYIKENKEVAIVALNNILDQIYNLTDIYFEENDVLKEGLIEDKKLENFIKSLRQDTTKYEKVRSKILKGDFNLSLFEVNLVGLAFMYIKIYWEKEIGGLEKLKKIAEKGFENLIDNESEKLDFSKEK